ncbi:unnamed protein product [Cylicostephanus goldi]|uniref:Uncharacterized protein n=1 Tax=Cylicostephanus goldi TaxID=71465 RepID=A0A3P6T290_CYLGO|nr:unnamed protein product [Cylicostephanus goldi]
MDTYEKLEVHPDMPPPPPPDLPPPPEKSAPLMPPMKEHNEKFNEHDLKPLRAGDDVNLSDTPKRPLLPKKAPPAKPIKCM